jgi:hypothetical protein
VNPILPGEALDQIFFVLPDPLNEIGRDTYIERAVRTAGQDIDARVLHAGFAA